MRVFTYAVISFLLVATVTSTGVSIWLFLELQKQDEQHTQTQQKLHQKYQARLQKQKRYTDEVITLYQDQVNINEALIAEYNKVKDNINSLRGYFSDHTLLTKGVEPRLKTTFDSDKFNTRLEQLNTSFNYYQNVIEEKDQAKENGQERIKQIQRNYPELQVEVSAKPLE
jgi:hypothetical protein